LLFQRDLFGQSYKMFLNNYYNSNYNNNNNNNNNNNKNLII